MSRHTVICWYVLCFTSPAYLRRVGEHMDREVVDTPQRQANEDHPL